MVENELREAKEAKNKLHPDFLALIERYKTDSRFSTNEKADLIANLNVLKNVFETIEIPSTVEAIVLFGSYSRQDKKPHYDENTKALFNSDMDILILDKKEPLLRRIFHRLDRMMGEGSFQAPDSFWSDLIDKRLRALNNKREISINPYFVQYPFISRSQNEWVKTGTLLYGNLPKKLTKNYGKWINGGASVVEKVQPSAMI